MLRSVEELTSGGVCLPFVAEQAFYSGFLFAFYSFIDVVDIGFLRLSPIHCYIMGHPMLVGALRALRLAALSQSILNLYRIEFTLNNSHFHLENLFSLQISLVVFMRHP